MDIENSNINENVTTNLVSDIKIKYPWLYIVEKNQINVSYVPEKENGYIEYKRTLINCCEKSIQRYATQMNWRICENIKKKYAVYYIGIGDDGTIFGLNNHDLLVSIDKIVTISQIINASISQLEIINIENRIILKFIIKNKKILSNYSVNID